MRDSDIKKSKFIAKSLLTTGDYLDFVRNGQNFRISYADFVASLGISGNIASIGDVTAIPVFYLLGGINYIRSIIGGSAITASLSAAGGVKLDHNFTVNKTGAPVLANESAVSPTIRSIVGGTGITVAASGDIIQISESGTPGSTKTVYVYQESDFPTAVGGVITLEDDTEYYLLNDVSTASRFIFGSNTVITGSDSTLINLTYTGAATMFTIADKSVKIKDVYLTCTSGTMFNWTDSVGTNIFRLFSCGISVLNLGNFDDGGIIYIDNVNVYVLSGTGLTFSGNINVLIINICGFTKASGSDSVIDLDAAVFYSVNIDKVLFQNNGTGYCITGAASSANIQSIGIGTITNILQLGSADILENLSPFDDRWQMELNSQIVDSYDEVLTTRGSGNVVIAAATTPAIVGATWTMHEEHRITGTAGGRFTYNGKGSHVVLQATISSSIVTGTDDATFFFYKNGVQIAASAVTREYTAGDIGNINMLWSDEAENGDYYELWVQNDDTGVDITITKITMRIAS